jgi:Tol biopolymer transport system component
MTIEQRLERDLPAILGDLAMGPYPDYIDDVLSTTARRGQRPSWAFPERWLPVELVPQRATIARLPWRQLGVLALIAALLALMLAAYVGSQRRLPQPYGLARNGVVTFVTPEGAIAFGDPRDGRQDIVVTESRQVRAPSFSLDGTRVAYERSDPDGVRVMVVDLERRARVEVAKVPAAADKLHWSPDGKRIALLSAGQAWIVQTDGSGAKALGLELDADAEIEWRPPDGKQLVVRGIQDGKAGLFLVSLDGPGPRLITPMTAGENDYLWVTWSPDGSRLAYSKAEPHEVHIIEVDRGIDTLIQGDTGVGLMFPRWSPDGTRIAVMTWLSDAPIEVQVGVVPADDPTPHVTLTGPTFSKGIQHDWAPDGTAILAAEWESSQPWLLDPNGGSGTKLAMSASFPDWIEWQRLAP